LLQNLFRLLTETGPATSWLVVFLAIVVSVLLCYVGIAMAATLCARDQQRAEIC
jgi:hypothetical protein